MTVNELLQKLIDLCKEGRADWIVKVSNGHTEGRHEPVDELSCFPEDKEVWLDS